MSGESPFRVIGTKARLVDRVVSEVQSLIIDGRLEPGMKLPPEREFAEQIGVSRTVVREAVRILATKGLLETKPGVGTIVRQVTRDQVVEPLGMLLQTQGISLENLHHVRSILEVEIAGLAALQATERDIAELSRIIAEMEVAVDAPEVFVARDADFHQTLAKMSHNPLLAVLLDSIRDLMQEVRLLVHRHPHLYEIVMPGHHRIMERVIAKDPEGARQAMQEHLEHARRIQEEVVARQDW
jgi:GntR family transcriptional repressor for pyruvate dehydrogenase complex